MSREYEITVILDSEDGFAEVALTINTTTRKKALTQAKRLIKDVGRQEITLEGVPEDDE